MWSCGKHEGAPVPQSAFERQLSHLPTMQNFFAPPHCASLVQSTQPSVGSQAWAPQALVAQTPPPGPMPTESVPPQAKARKRAEREAKA